MKALSIHPAPGIELPRLLFLFLGFVPIGSLCIALLDLIPLDLSARFAVLPTVGVGIWLGLRFPQAGRLAICGLMAGVLATAIYDGVRFVCIWLGVLSDFIPAIGRMALADQAAHPLWGYLWRYLGNGGAMGMAFAMLPWRSIRAGIVYGVGICLCLFATLILAPGAQMALFPLTPITAAAALLGHLVYGSVLAGSLRLATGSFIK